MRIPHTIPKLVLKAYTRKLSPEELQKSYEGRLLRAEDAEWDLKGQPTLRDVCLDHVVDEYVFYVKLVEELNKQKLEAYEKRKAQWQIDRANYLERKVSYERRKLEHEEYLANRLLMGDDPNDADDDDVDDEDRPIVKKGLQEPEYIPDVFPEFVPIGEVLNQMWDEDRIQTIEDLDIDYVPFEIAVLTIPDDYYWERASNEKWDYILDADDHGKKWRRLYLERTIWEALESFHPVDGDLEDLQQLVDLVAPEIIEIKLNNLIPVCFGTPRKPLDSKIPEADFTPQGAEEDQGYGDGEEDEQEMKQLAKDKAREQKEKERKEKKIRYEMQQKAAKEIAENPPDAAASPLPVAQLVPLVYEEPDRSTSDHFDFGLILSKFTSLKVLSLVYELQETGLDWEPRLFIFTDMDCLNLANALADTPSLETFELLRSHVNDEQCKTLIREGLIKMPHLKKINFSYNRISDSGARAIARLLTDPTSRAIHTIHTVALARNKIHNRGGKALAWALTKNRHLTHLDLRLNRMGDPAGRDFAHALAKNSSLLVLLLGANRLTESTAFVINKMLFHNTTLKELDLSSNDLGKKGGEHVALGIRANTNILRVDVRLANIGLDFEYDVGTHLRKNRNRILNQYSLMERDDTYPNETESGILVEKEIEVLIEPEWSSEEEEEEEGEDEEEEDECEEDEEEDGEEMDGEEEEDDIQVQVVKAPGSLDMSKTLL